DYGPLPVADVARIGLAVLGALSAAHDAGVLHRDVKPGNVLLADDGRVVLADFGIARLVGDATLTTGELLVGSPSYISPEPARRLTARPARMMLERVAESTVVGLPGAAGGAGAGARPIEPGPPPRQPPPAPWAPAAGVAGAAAEPDSTRPTDTAPAAWKPEP